MFNNDLKKSAIRNLEVKVSELKKVNEVVVISSEELYSKRMILKKILEETNDYLNTIANKPKSLEITVNSVQLSLNDYQEMLDSMAEEIRKNNISSGISAGASIAAGASVAALAPTAAMGIATTFGVASTGTAISTLSGAAATNAALAWLGGGALAAGGGGMAGGSAILALAGPLGWVIGGTALAGSGLLLNGKNKKVAHQANTQAIEVEKQIKLMLEIDEKIRLLTLDTRGINSSLQERLPSAKKKFPLDYLAMDSNQKYLLAALVNTMQTGKESLTKSVNPEDNN